MTTEDEVLVEVVKAGLDDDTGVNAIVECFIEFKTIATKRNGINFLLCDFILLSSTCNCYYLVYEDRLFQ